MPTPKTKRAIKVSDRPLENILRDRNKGSEVLYKRRFKQLNIAQQIVGRRKELGMTQIQLAAKAGVTQPQISKVESGDFKNFEIKTLVLIADALGAYFDFTLVVDDKKSRRTRPPGDHTSAAAGASNRG